MKTKEDEATRRNISEWGRPGAWLISQYGRVTYRQWCEKEAARITTRAHRAVVVEWMGLVAVAQAQADCSMWNKDKG